MVIANNAVSKLHEVKVVGYNYTPLCMTPSWSNHNTKHTDVVPKMDPRTHIPGYCDKEEHRIVLFVVYFYRLIYIINVHVWLLWKNSEMSKSIYIHQSASFFITRT